MAHGQSWLKVIAKCSDINTGHLVLHRHLHCRGIVLCIAMPYVPSGEHFMNMCISTVDLYLITHCTYILCFIYTTNPLIMLINPTHVPHPDK